ncbi:MAG: hypothetical protein KY464_08750 [Gemmatimonadetes bacterium]|nr:hypothetical protein [Gemmatimonadota bacterium]
MANARLTLRGHQPRAAELVVVYRAPRTRATRALLSLVGLWALAPVVAVVPPHIPWAVIAFCGGIYFAIRQWTGEYLVHRFEGACPRCAATLPLSAGSRIRLPHSMVCYSCHHEPVLEVQ